MDETTPGTPESELESEHKGGESRRACSIRFSDPEWKTVETTATAHGMNAAEFARHAALGVASGRYGAGQGSLPPRYTALVARIFRSTHILILKRDELTREGRGKELDELIKATRALQDSLLEGAETTAATDESGTSRL